MSNFNLKDHGIYITQLDREILPLLDHIAHYSQLLITKTQGRNINFKNGSYLRHQHNVEEIVKRGNDLNVSRIYKIELIYLSFHQVLKPFTEFWNKRIL